MYDVWRYYKEKIFVKFNTADEIKQFDKEVKKFARDVPKVIYTSPSENTSRYYVSSWRGAKEEKTDEEIGFIWTDDVDFLHKIEEYGWHIVNVSELICTPVNMDKLLNFICGGNDNV